MKKLLILPVLLLFATAGFPQLKVLSSGDTYIPFGKSYRIGATTSNSKRLRMVHAGGNDAVIEYYNNLWFNTGISSSRSDRIHAMIMYSSGNITMKKRLRVDDRIAIGRFGSYKLDVNGEARVGSIIYDSDKRYKENIKPMKDDLDKLKKLKPVSYQYKEKEVAPNDTSSVADETLSVNSRRKKRERMGFVAQDFQKIYPELVYEDEKGYLGIDYVSLIPVLVETLQEQQKQIDKLERKVKRKKGKDKNARTAASDLPSVDQVLDSETVLYQNRPNPFSESTEIDLALAEDAGDAYLYVYDMQGTQQKKYPVQGKGKTSVVIRGSELSAGMYMYALVVGNEVIDTKKMILTD